MTAENRSRHCLREWSRALESRTDFEILAERGRWAAAVARGYYSMFYMARALLFALGLEARSHSGAATLLSEHLVRSGQFPAAEIRSLRQMQRLREDADYDTAQLFEEDAVLEMRDPLETFQAAAATWLRSQGYPV